MTRLSKLFGSNLPGNFINNPDLLPKLSVNRDNDLLKDGVASAYTSNEAGFWSAVGNFGNAVNVTVPDTYPATELANISGEGVVGNIVLPFRQNASTGYTSTVRIVLDGAEYTYAVTASSAYSIWRPVMGSLFPVAPQTATVQDAMDIGSYLDIGWDIAAVMESYPWPPLVAATMASPVQLLAMGMPMLYFKDSLIVEVKCDVISGATYEARGGITYVMLS